MILDSLKQKQKQLLEPAKWVLMLHMNTHSGIFALSAAQHVLQDHLGIPRNEAINIVDRAVVQGKHVIKPVTKDVGETMLSEATQCSYSNSSDFRISLEQA